MLSDDTRNGETLIRIGASTRVTGFAELEGVCKFLFSPPLKCTQVFRRYPHLDSLVVKVPARSAEGRGFKSRLS